MLLIYTNEILSNKERSNKNTLKACITNQIKNLKTCKSEDTNSLFYSKIL